MDHHQGFVIGVSSGGRPVEGSCDHFLVVDHGELVVDILEKCLSALNLRDAHAAPATVEARRSWRGRNRNNGFAS